MVLSFPYSFWVFWFDLALGLILMVCFAVATNLRLFPYLPAAVAAPELWVARLQAAVSQCPQPHTQARRKTKKCHRNTCRLQVLTYNFTSTVQ